MKYFNVRVERSFKEIAWVPVKATSWDDAYRAVFRMSNEKIKELAENHQIVGYSNDIWDVGERPVVEEVV